MTNFELDPDKKVCKICGLFIDEHGFRPTLYTHIEKEHGITLKEYYDKFYRDLDSKEGICPQCGKETSFGNLHSGYSKFCSKSCHSTHNITKTYASGGFDDYIKRLRETILPERNKSKRQREICSKKMSETVNELWKDPKFIKLRQKCSHEQATKMWTEDCYSGFRKSALDAVMSRKAGWGHCGEFVSDRLGKTFNYKSSYELRFFQLLEESGLYYNYESWYIPYKVDGRFYRYIPDFYVELDSQKLLVEIKPNKNMDMGTNQLKFEVAREFCCKRGIIFVVLDEVIFSDNFDLMETIRNLK